MKNRLRRTNMILTTAVVLTSLVVTMSSSAEDLLIVTLSCNDDGDRIVTITATDGLSAVDASGSTQTGFYLADIYNGGGVSFDSSATGDLTSANNPSNGNPLLFRQGNSLGLNVFNYSNDTISTFTSGEIAFSGSLANVFTFNTVPFEQLISGNRQGNIYFPADTDFGIPNAQLIGTYVVDVQVILGDANQDLSLNLLDVDPFVNTVFGQSCQVDVNEDGMGNLLDAAPFADILAAVPTANYQVAPVGPTGDFFWSTSGLNQGATNSELNLELEVGESATLFLYYSTNGPADSDLTIGAGINVAASAPGVIAFNSAESLDFPITIGGSILDSRWSSGLGGHVGPANEVTDELVIGLTAFSVGGEGIRESNNGNPFLDEGFDPAADAFLFATVDIVGTAPGTITLAPGFNDLGIVTSFDQILAAQFTDATITVTSDVVLGDVNLDGKVNLLDVGPFVNLLAEGIFQAEADINQDGVLDLLDVGPFVNLLAGK